MTPKIISYDVEIKSTSKLWVQKVPEVYTNDSNSVKIQFNLIDCTEAELLNSTAQVLLYMRDGSFFQNTGVDVVRTGTTFSYTLKDNEGNHQGLTEVQLVLTIAGTPNEDYASQMYQFKIKNGLGNNVPVETFIQTWETLTTEANAFIAQMETDVQEFDVALESGVLATNIAAKLNNLETTYSPRLLSAEQQLAETMKRKAKFKFAKHCTWSYSSGSWIATLAEMKAFIDTYAFLHVDEIYFELHFRKNGSDEMYIMQNMDTLLEAKAYAESKGLVVSTLKIMTHSADYGGQGTLFTTMQQSQYLALLDVALTKFQGIENAIVCNEFNKMFGSSAYESFVLACIAKGKSYGYLTSICISTGASGVYEVVQTLLPSCDFIAINVYPKISVKLANTSLQDGVDAWESNLVYNTVEELRLRYGKPIKITETGCQDYWICLTNPSGWAWPVDYQVRSNGKADAIMLNGAFEALNGKVDTIVQFWHEGFSESQCVAEIEKITREWMVKQ